MWLDFRNCVSDTSKKFHFLSSIYFLNYITRMTEFSLSVSEQACASLSVSLLVSRNVFSGNNQLEVREIVHIHEFHAVDDARSWCPRNPAFLVWWWLSQEESGGRAGELVQGSLDRNSAETQNGRRSRAGMRLGRWNASPWHQLAGKTPIDHC